MKRIKCSKNPKAETTKDCEECHKRYFYAITRALCVRENAIIGEGIINEQANLGSCDASIKDNVGGPVEVSGDNGSSINPDQKRKRGRPRTRPLPDPNKPKGKRGRPRKIIQ